MLKAKILQEQGKTQIEIAEALGVTDRTIRNYLRRHDRPPKARVRKSKLDGFKDFIDTVLDDNPFLNREILIERLRKQGYQGRISILRDYAAAVTKRVTRAATIRFETEPGRQAQVDWKEFGRQTVDGRPTKLYAFVMVLGYSRKPFVRFTTSMDQATLLACHVLAFDRFGGVPHEILYDNMRTAFAPDTDGVWQATKRLLALGAHYGFAPRRCRVRRPETKGKVERTIGYLDNNFWPRMEGRELSLAGLNAEVGDWIEAISSKTIVDLGESRAARFERERRELKRLPATDFDVRTELPLHVGREGTIRHEGNRYTVPAAFIGELVGLLVHPLHRNVELKLPDGSSRRFTLAASGSHERIEFPGDGSTLRRRWQIDRERTARRRRPRRRALPSDIEVATGTVSAYEALSGLKDASEGIPA
jgi:transposase